MTQANTCSALSSTFGNPEFMLAILRSVQWRTEIMPRRSNEFQQLVLLIQRQLAGDAASVTESKMLKDKGTGSDVEVDIVVELEVNAVRLSLGFECTAETRRATVEWVREMWGKHSSLNIDKTILVAKAGFTDEAELFAKSKNILTLTFGQAVTAEWSAWLETMNNLRIASVTFTPVDITVRVRRLQGDTISTHPDTRVRWPSLGLDATIHDYWLSVLTRRDLFKGVMRRWLAAPIEARPNAFDFTATITPDPLIEIATDEGHWRDVEHVTIRVNATVNDLPLQLVAGKLDRVEFAYARLPNIFTKGSAEYVIVNLLSAGQGPAKAAVLLPTSGSETVSVHHMRMSNET